MKEFLECLNKNKYSIIISLIMTLLTYFVAVLMIHYLYIILYYFGVDAKLTQIFSQLSDARVNIHVIIPLISYYFLSILVLRINYKKRKIFRIIAISLLVLFIFILVTLISVILSTVNDMSFIDIIISLLENMEGLGL